MRRRSMACAGLWAAVVGVGCVIPTAAEARPGPTGRHVIVVLKRQFTAVPDTRANVRRRDPMVYAAQAGVVSALRAGHARHLVALQLIDAVAAVVSPHEAQRLTVNPAVAHVINDPVIRVPAAPSIAPPSLGTTGSNAAACPPPGQVQLEPEAVEDIHAAEPPGGPPSAQGLGYTGAGVKVAFLANGLDIHNPDLTRSNGQPVVIDDQDFSGDGTDGPVTDGEAFLDASAIAAQGRETYDLGPLTGVACHIRVLGVAPGASLVALDVTGSEDFAYGSDVLAAINYAVNVDHVDVINESIGANPFPDNGFLDLDRMVNDAATAAGVTIVAGTGDSGANDTQASPSTDPLAISAGASTTLRVVAQTTFPSFIGSTGWLSDNIASLSSAGFDQAGSALDVVAPGDKNWALCTPDPVHDPVCEQAPLQLASGTSQSAPLTAGAAALVIEAYEHAHGGARPTPAVVKQIITSTAEDIDAPAEQQGAGLVDAYAAVQAAASYPASPTPNGHELLQSPGRFAAVAPAGTPQTFTETLTNTGTAAQTTQLDSRTLGPYVDIAQQTLNLTDTDYLKRVTFTVPPDQGRLDAAVAYTAATPLRNPLSDVEIWLLDPEGHVVNDGYPQGNGNHNDGQVSDPQPGTWTAVIFNETLAADGGTVGPVRFAAATARWEPFGTLSTHELTLTPGQSASFTLHVATPSAPGDQAGSIVITDEKAQPTFTQTTTIPVTLRSLVPTPDPTTSFTGTLLGGNGRAISLSQAAYYEVQIPRGTPELNATVQTADPANALIAELIDPATGQAAATAASGTPGPAAGTIVAQRGAELHVLHPRAGRWTLAIDFEGMPSGKAIAQPLTVRLDRLPVPVTVSSAPSTLTARPGRPTTLELHVTNTGTVPEAYFVDSRRYRSITVPLAPLDGAQTSVPVNPASPPLYLVPSHTSAITSAVTAPVPIYYDYWWAFGDPDLSSTSPTLSATATGEYSAGPVAAGEWGISPYQTGPDGSNPVAPVTAQTAMTATTQAFDTQVTSPTGDLWLRAVRPAEAVTPVLAAPGQTVTIPVTIAPVGPAGRAIRGTVYVDNITRVAGPATWYSPAAAIDQADDVAALHYRTATRPSKVPGGGVTMSSES